MDLKYSQSKIEVLPEIARRLNVVLLKREQGATFRLLESPPEWFYLVFSRQEREDVINLENASLFLDGFLTDAEQHWGSERPEPLKSGVWHEFDQRDQEYYLEAVALYVNGEPILVIQSLGEDYEVRVQLFQKARNYVLQSQNLDHETQKNDILLHFLTMDLVPPVQRLNGLLQELRESIRSGDNDSVEEKLQAAVKIAHRQDITLDSFLKGFSTEIVAMQHISRDESTSPDVNDVVRSLVKSELDDFLNRSVGLSMDSAIPKGQHAKVVGHRTRLEKIVASLMHFALRRAPQGASVNLRVATHGDDWILTELYESVASLSEDEEGIFEQLLSFESLVHKSALSLYFCKITIERWGGEIGYRREGEGGCWWFRLRRVG